MKIRKIQSEDLIDVLKVENTCFKYPYEEQTFLSYYEQQPAGFFVAEERKKIVGYVLSDLPEKEIMSIAVLPKSRRKGIGSRLLENSLKFFNSKKVKKVKLHVRKNNKMGQGFYKHHNFKIIRTVKDYYTDGDGILLEKVLY